MQFYLPDQPAAGWQPGGNDHPRTRHQVRHRGPRRHRSHVPGAGRNWRNADGYRHHAFDLWLLQWLDPGGLARLLCHGQGWAICQKRCEIASQLQNSRHLTDGADGLDLHPVRLRQLRTTARLHYLRRAGVLYPHHFWIVRAAPHASQRGTPVSCDRLPGAAGNLYCDGFIYRCRTITLQTAVHLAGTHYRSAGDSGVFLVVAEFGSVILSGVEPSLREVSTHSAQNDSFKTEGEIKGWQ